MNKYLLQPQITVVCFLLSQCCRSSGEHTVVLQWQISPFKLWKSVNRRRSSGSPCTSGLAVMSILSAVCSVDKKCDPAADQRSSTCEPLLVSGGARLDCASGSQSGGGVWFDEVSRGEGSWHWHVGPQRFLKALKMAWMCFSRSSRSKGSGWLVTADIVSNWKQIHLSQIKFKAAKSDKSLPLTIWCARPCNYTLWGEHSCHE